MSFFFQAGILVNLFFLSSWSRKSSQVVSCGMLIKCGIGSVGGDEAGKRAKTTPDAGGKSVSEKSQATRTCSNLFEKSESKQTEFFVREVKDKRMTKNGPHRVT
jgi:hypothetical protein